MAASPQARQEVEAIAALAARLQEAPLVGPPVEPSPALREAVERRLTEVESAERATVRSPARPWWRRRVVALAAAAACLAIVAVPIALSMKALAPAKPEEVAKQSAAPTSAAHRLTNQEVQEKLAQLVDQFNKSNSEGRYEEARAIAARAKELAPNELVSKVMGEEARLTMNGARDVNVAASPFSEEHQNASKGFEHRDKVIAGGKPPGTNDPALRRDLATTETHDFDELKKLIAETVNQKTWSNSGTSGTIAAGTTNLSLVIEQSQSVVEQDTKNQATNRELLDSEAKVRQMFDRYDPLVDERRKQLNGPQSGSGNKSGVQPAKIESIPGMDILVLRNPTDSGGAANGAGRIPSSGTYGGPTTVSAGTLNLTGIVTNGGNGSAPLDVQPPADAAPALQVTALHPAGADAMASALEALAGGGGNTTVTLYGSDRLMGTAGKLPTGIFINGNAGLGAPGLKISEQKPESKKFAETWKPARVVPNASRLMVGDKEELPT